MRRDRAAPTPIPLAVLLLGAAGVLAGGCGDNQKPGVLIRVRGEAGNLPDLVIFDWMAPGYPVLVSGLLAAHPVAADPTLFGTLFIETRPVLVEDRVIAIRGQRAGEIVSGGWGLLPASTETFRARDIQLGPPLADNNGNGTPDIVERCTNPQTAERCGEPRADTDAGPLPSPDGPEPDTAEPPDAGAPDAPADVGVPDAARDSRDAGITAVDTSIPITLPR